MRRFLWFLVLLFLVISNGNINAYGLEVESTSYDEPVKIKVTGCTPGEKITLRLRAELDYFLESWATFVADDNGVINPAQQSPLEGTYEGVEPMGLFMFMEEKAQNPDYCPEEIDPLEVTHRELTLEVGGEQIAAREVERYLVGPKVEVQEIREEGLVGTFFRPPGDGPFPAIMVLGGSGGGLNPQEAALLANHGYATLALAYFGTEDLPLNLQEIPLEYFATAMAWLQGRNEAEKGGVFVRGGSRGGELALLLGSYFPEAVRGVIASMASGVVWQAVGQFDQPAWTYREKPVPFVPIFTYGPAESWRETYIKNYDFYQGEVVEEATIPVEDIEGPVLLVSGGDDKLWPADKFAGIAEERLGEHDHPYFFEHMVFPEAGHSLGVPYRLFCRSVRCERYLRGGTPEANAEASEKAWQAMLDFLEEF